MTRVAFCFGYLDHLDESGFGTHAYGNSHAGLFHRVPWAIAQSLRCEVTEVGYRPHFATVG